MREDVGRRISMDKKQFAVFASALRTFYPRENLLPNQQAMELWFKQLSDIPYEIAEATLQKWVSLNKWSPSIADIRETAADVTNGEIADWGDAWEKVLRAISKFGSYNEAKALESMDEMTRTCVKRLGFKNICMSENIATDRANFRMIFESLADRKKKEQQTPAALRTLIESIQQQTLMIEEMNGVRKENDNG